MEVCSCLYFCIVTPWSLVKDNLLHQWWHNWIINGILTIYIRRLFIVRQSFAHHCFLFHATIPWSSRRRTGKILLTFRQRSIYRQSEMLTAFSKTMSNFQMWFLSWVLGPLKKKNVCGFWSWLQVVKRYGSLKETSIWAFFKRIYIRYPPSKG